MKKVKFLTAALAALVLASCSSELEGPSPSTVTNEGDAPVAFNVSAAGSTTGKATRAGQSGIINGLDDLKDFKNFGVFGYYTDAATFDADASKPNFMYNQKVEWDGEEWGYSPVKYWPNEWAANVENGGTTSGSIDHLSFFAYAPYVGTAYLPGSETGQYGIINMTKNTETGAPVLTYRANTEGTGVDLLWAVSKDDYSSRSEQTVEAGFPFVDLIKPIDHSSRIPFHFRHALAKIGVTAKVFVDNAEYDDANTRVVIEEVELLPATDGESLFNDYGKLSLQNTEANTPAWSDVTANTTSYKFAANDMVSDLRYKVPQGSRTAYTAQGNGLTTTAQNLLLDKKGALFIPDQKDASGDLASHNVKVRVKYHVITRDDALEGKASDVVNDITSAEITGLKLTAGKTSMLNLTLTLTQVLVTVEDVDAWEVDEDAERDVAYSEEFYFTGGNRKLVFAKGNLQYDITNGKWQIASTQYEVLGESQNGNVENQTGLIDLFGWNTAKKPTRYTQTPSDYTSTAIFNNSHQYDNLAKDWGDVAATDIGEGWFTPDYYDMFWIMEYRANAHKLFAQGMVGDQRGFFLLPDNWVLPEGITFTSYAEDGTTGYTNNHYTLAQWQKMEANGAVFLPQGGHRQTRSDNKVKIHDNGHYHGFYWTSTNYWWGDDNDKTTYSLGLQFDHENSGYYYYQLAASNVTHGFSVRLCKVLE